MIRGAMRAVMANNGHIDPLARDICMTIIKTVEDLETLYGQPGETSTAKEIAYISPEYRTYIEASPFVALATAGPEGLDCSPRGDRAGFVRIHDEQTLMMPDRRGNNRVDSLRNIVRDPRVGLLFVIPGSGNTLRINGRAHLDTDPALLDSFRMEGKAPRSVIVIAVDAVYFQCARAIVRADLWNPALHVDPKTLPTAGQILAALSNNRVGGETYDREWPERAKASMW
jgi:PPOX class probable FMN-dependent enzyme